MHRLPLIAILLGQLELLLAHHEKRCWLCCVPLRLLEATIDHYLPESLLNHPEQFAQIRTQWGLPENFNINGFENWLPSHQRCNQLKGATEFEFTPAHSIIVHRLLERAPDVQKTAVSIGANTKKDKVIGYILAALKSKPSLWTICRSLPKSHRPSPK